MGNPKPCFFQNSEMEQIISYVLFTLITVLGLVANVTSFFVFLRNRKKFPRISRMLLQNQAVADICVCVFGIGMYTQKHTGLYVSKNAVFDEILCHTWHGQAIYWTSILVSVWALVLLAIERFLMVVYPYAHRNIKEKQIYLATSGTFLIILIMTIPLYFQVSYDRKEGKCMRGHNQLYFKTDSFRKFMSVYATFWFIIIYVVPISCFVGLYSKVILTLRRRVQDQGQTHQGSRIFSKANKQMTKTGIAVAVVSMICLSWDSLFYFIAHNSNLEYEFGTHRQHVGVFLAALNSCANPFIYLATLPIFKRSLEKAICGVNYNTVTGSTNMEYTTNNDGTTPSVGAKEKTNVG